LNPRKEETTIKINIYILKFVIETKTPTYGSTFLLEVLMKSDIAQGFLVIRCINVFGNLLSELLD